MRRHTRVCLLAGLVLGLFSAHAALAAWPNQPGVNLKLSNAPSDQRFPAMVSDGAGGAIVTWYDTRSGNADIYAQHVLASGVVDPGWTANGTPLCDAAGDQVSPTIVSDGAGGAFITWTDGRGGPNYDIYAQHVLASGVVDPAWTVNGAVLCDAASTQTSPKIVADGTGGAIVTWGDYRSGTNNDVYAQHVLASGAMDPAWTVNGALLCNAANNQFNATIVSDEAGGAIVTWQDFRGGANYDIYAQHVLASGVVDPSWTANGTLLCNAANDQMSPMIVADGTGGAIVTWSDGRAAGGDIYAQHVVASGMVDVAWTVNGTPLCNAANSQVAPTIVSDGAGGAIVTWQDLRSGSGNDVYAQHVLASGLVDAAWTANGTLICNAANDQYYPTIAADGAGGAIVTWYDFRSGASYDIYAQHVQASGVVDGAWTANGALLCSATLTQDYPTIVSDGAGGAIVTWEDYRAGNFDIYAQRIARFGYRGTPEAEITGVGDVPNDDGGTVKLAWNASYLDLNSDANLAAYDIYRSVPPNLVAERLARGAPVARGFAGLPVTAAIVLDATQGYAWEYVATTSPAHFAEAYSYLAPTAGDSTGWGNPLTAFLVLARNSTGSKFWASRPDSGYSVDNLSPLPPSSFNGEYTAGVAYLHWSPNPEADLAGYRLYRGAALEFTPSPANRIAAPTETGYADPAGATYYYKLSAVDVHGNESGFAALLPSGAVDVPGAPAPRELALSRPSPNPARGSSEFSVSLPRESRVTLAIRDAAGRTVRRIADGTRPAGTHAYRWDLRDDAGRAVRSGLYFVSLAAGGRTLTARLTVTR